MIDWHISSAASAGYFFVGFSGSKAIEIYVGYRCLNKFIRFSFCSFLKQPGVEPQHLYQKVRVIAGQE